MGEETLADEVSKSEPASAAVEAEHIKSRDSLNEKMEVESNGVDTVQDNEKDLETEKTEVGKVVKDNEDWQDGISVGESKTEAVEIEAAGEGTAKEKECEQKADKDLGVNGVEDEKMTEHEEKAVEKVEGSEEKKKEEQAVEGSKKVKNDADADDGSEEVNIAEEVEENKEVKIAEEVEENEEVKIAEKVDETGEEVKEPNELEGSLEEKNTDEIEMCEEEKKEEVSRESQEKENDEGMITNNKEKKASKKRSRRESAGGRRDRKKKEVDEVENKDKETAIKEKSHETKKNKNGEKKEEKDEKELVRTPIMDRPVRERKSVERLVSIIEKDDHKEFNIEKGPGTPLKDIPNVASQLRRRNDETLKLLHNLLFGRRCKAFEIRGHISRFSGYVWHDNEEKQRNKVKEKFDKCTKEKLLEICDVLDIQVSRTSVKKEELVIKLIDFLVSPFATTTVVLSDEPTKAQKRKRVVKQSSSGSAKRSVKSRKKDEDSFKRKGGRLQSNSDNSSEENEEDGSDDEVEAENGTLEKSDDEMTYQSESEEEDVSEELGDKARKRKGKAKSYGKKDFSGKAKNKKTVTVQKVSRSKAADDGYKRVSSKKNETGIKKSPTPTKSSGKKDAKGKSKLKDVKPSDEELRNAICEILKEVDFNMATFTDILKQLARQFDMDLTSRKSSIKLMIQEELTKLADEADDEEDDEGESEKEEGDTGKDETAAAAEGTEVKA